MRVKRPVWRGGGATSPILLRDIGEIALEYRRCCRGNVADVVWNFSRRNGRQAGNHGFNRNSLSGGGWRQIRDETRQV